MSARTIRTLRTLLAFALVAAAGAHAADAWPTKPIRMIVPSGAGAASDLLARLMAERMSAEFGQQVVVENRPGASGAIGISAVAKAPADGYTLLYNNGSFAVMAPALMPEYPYHPLRDVTPIALTVVGGVFIVVNPQVPAKNLRELVELIRAKPGAYTYGSWAVGSAGHLIMEWLKREAGLRIDHVPYKTMPSLLAELSAGVIPIGWVDIVSSASFIRAGKIRGIAISGNDRVPATPDIPTMGEQGYPFEPVGWQGIFGPPGIPPALIERINEAVNRIQGTNEVRATMTRMNLPAPPIKSVGDFRDLIAKDLQVWRKIVVEAKIKPEQ